MLRLVYSQNRIFLTSSARLISSVTAPNYDKNNSDGSNNKKVQLDISQLFKETESIEPKQSLKNLMKKMKQKGDTSKNKKVELKKKLSTFDAKKHKQGEQFWFKKQPIEVKKDEESLSKIVEKSEIREKDVKIVAKVVESDTVEIIENDVVESKNAILESKPLQVNQLKGDIKERADNRSVSKLMSALIDEIDDNLANPEEMLKSLMTTMGRSKQEVVDLSEEKPQSMYSRLRDKQQGKKKRLSLTHGKTTELFTGQFNIASDPDIHESLHENKWYKDLSNVLPESVPQNSFDKMMLNIDKQWNFPVDNEQDMGIEDETSFEEHVFLDHLLDDFPETGPVRKFIELVITGLQQNPHLSVTEKEERVLWFKNYFEKFPESDLLL